MAFPLELFLPSEEPPPILSKRDAVLNGAGELEIFLEAAPLILKPPSGMAMSGALGLRGREAVVLASSPREKGAGAVFGLVEVEDMRLSSDGALSRALPTFLTFLEGRGDSSGPTVRLKECMLLDDVEGWPTLVEGTRCALDWSGSSLGLIGTSVLRGDGTALLKFPGNEALLISFAER